MGWISWGNWNDWGEWSDAPRMLDTLGSTYGDCIEVIAALEVEVSYAIWLPLTQNWLYQCRLNSLGKVRLKPEMPPYVAGWGSYCSTINLEKVESGDPAFRFSQDSTASNFGAFPHEGDHPDYSPVYDALLVLVSAGLSKMNAYVAFGLTAVQVISALCGEPDDTINEAERLMAEYEYPEYPVNGSFSPESSCWYCWEIRANSNDYVTFTLEYDFGAYEFLNPPSPAQVVHLINSSTWGIPTPPPRDRMTPEEKDRYGFVELSIHDIEKQASEFGVSFEKIKGFVREEESVYILTNLEVKLESSNFTSKIEPIRHKTSDDI
ncbi:hypothetical protein [Methanolobus sp. WCC5]|uniref:hypothetical protein n=1 Tax=Methanolobus sp. WCC5 TaxID=3125785 RepID=UPI0032464773